MDNQEICAMMYSMRALQSRGISLLETLKNCVSYLLLCYEVSKEEKYLELAELQLQAYVNMGNALDGSVREIQKILSVLGKSEKDFRPDSNFGGKSVRLTNAQVRSIIGKWRPSRYNPMTITEVVRDIIEKVSGKETGSYFYKYHRYLDNDQSIPDVYELIVREDGSYFHDITNFRFYRFIMDESSREER